MKPASSPSQTHWLVVRRPRVTIQPHVKIATSAIEGAWVMVGSFTRYQSMNEPAPTSTVASAAQPSGASRQASRKQKKSPSSPHARPATHTACR